MQTFLTFELVDCELQGVCERDHLRLAAVERQRRDPRAEAEARAGGGRRRRGAERAPRAGPRPGRGLGQAQHVSHYKHVD